MVRKSIDIHGNLVSEGETVEIQPNPYGLEHLSSAEKEKVLAKRNEKNTPITNETKEETNKLKSELIVDGLPEDAYKLALKSLKLSDPIDSTFKSKLTQYQVNHGISVDKVNVMVGPETYMEMKAGEVLEKASERTNIIPSTQKEILFVLENGNPEGKNFIGKNGLFNFLCNFRKKPTGTLDYTNFFSKLDNYFENNEKFKNKKIEKTLNNDGTLLGNGGLADVVKGKMTMSEFWDKKKNSLIGFGKMALLISFIFGWMPDKLKGLPGMGNWYTRIPMLIGFFALGGNELVSAGIDEGKKMFEGDKSAGVNFTENVAKKIREWTGNTEAPKGLKQLENKLKTKNSEKGKEKLEENKLHTILEVYAGNKSVLDKKVSELKGINKIPSASLTESENKKLTDAKIDAKDLDKFNNLINSKKDDSNENQTLGDLIKSNIPEKTEVEKSNDKIKKIDVDSFTTIALINKQIKELDDNKAIIDADPTISPSDNAKFTKKYNDIKFKLIKKGAEIEKSEGTIGKYTKFLEKEKLSKNVIKSKEEIEKNNIEIDKLFKEIYDISKNINLVAKVKLENYLEKLENIKKLIATNTSELEKYKSIKDNDIINELKKEYIKQNKTIQVEIKNKLQNTLSDYFKNLKEKETEIGKLGLGNLGDIPKIKAFLEERKSDVYTKLATDLGIQSEEIKASDLLVKLDEKKQEILKSSVSKLPELEKLLLKLKGELDKTNSEDKKIIAGIDLFISKNIELKDIIVGIKTATKNKDLNQSTKEGLTAFTKYFNNLK